jgi:hypothetical protein
VVGEGGTKVVSTLNIQFGSEFAGVVRDRHRTVESEEGGGG